MRLAPTQISMTCFSRHQVTNIRVTRLCYFPIILACFPTFFWEVRYLTSVRKGFAMLKLFVVLQWRWLIVSEETFLVVMKSPITSFSCIISQCVLRVGGLSSSCCHLFEIDTQSFYLESLLRRFQTSQTYSEIYFENIIRCLGTRRKQWRVWKLSQTFLFIVPNLGKSLVLTRMFTGIF